MKKLLFAPFVMACLFAVTTTTPTPTAAAAPAPSHIGACRWFCGSEPRPFVTAKACAAACSSACDEVC